MTQPNNSFVQTWAMLDQSNGDMVVAAFYDALAARPADQNTLNAWVRRFPEHQDDLVYAAVTFRSEGVPASSLGFSYQPDEGKESSSAMQSLISRLVQERIGQSHPKLESLIEDGRKIGFSSRQLAERIGLDMPLFAKLEQRLIQVTTIPILLVERLANELSRSTEEIITYLSQSPRLAAQAQYKSKQAPSVARSQQQSFAKAMESSQSLSNEDRALWRDEMREGRLVGNVEIE